MTFRETARDTTIDSTEMVPTALATEEERETPVIHDEEDLPPVSEEVLTPLPAKGEDPVRLYLKEIGKVPLLTAQQEVQIGRRIEVGQIALRRALAGIPMSVRALLDVGDRLRRGEIAADDVIVLPEGGELEAKEIRPVVLAFARMRRFERKIVRLEESLDDRRRSASSRAAVVRGIGVQREAIQKTVAEMPLKPALIDDLVGKIRRHCKRLNELANEVRRNRTAAGTRELKRLETEAGLARKQLALLLLQIEESDRTVRQAKRELM
jgi:RNA polymerase primary sigma factor